MPEPLTLKVHIHQIPIHQPGPVAWLGMDLALRQTPREDAGAVLLGIVGSLMRPGPSYPPLPARTVSYREYGEEVWSWWSTLPEPAARLTQAQMGELIQESVRVHKALRLVLSPPEEEEVQEAVGFSRAP